MRESLVHGPPGCGKTTYVARQATRAAERHGEENVLICSLTRAAAREAAGRDTSVKPENIGTLHSICFRGLGCPKLVEKAELEEWNRENPALSVSGRHVATECELEDPRENRETDMFQELELLRARCIPQDVWPERLRIFSKRWSEWKRSHRLFDFTDLIEAGTKDLPVAPSSPAVIFADEVQDFSRLESRLLKGWALSCHHLVLRSNSIPGNALARWDHGL